MSNLVGKKCKHLMKEEEYELSDETVPKVLHKLVNYMSIIVKDSLTKKEQKEQEVEDRQKSLRMN
jgi:hypothetical protein